QDVFRGVTPFFVADALTIAGLVAFPQIVLWLPSQVSGRARPARRGLSAPFATTARAVAAPPRIFQKAKEGGARVPLFAF
ncbi:MAG: hypothetical protein VX878_01410, partial [Pseudomonadota bacterium]|nr:hypothetical protein [Pseudomonadota bacterium]